jgi:N-acetylglucosamine-6-phosphate deacetylase
MTTTFYTGRVFTGEQWLDDNIVVVNNNTIQAVQPGNPGTGAIDLQGGYLVPGFIDIQLYGGNGQLFSSHPSVASLQATYAFALAGGATRILPTMATNSTEQMLAAIEAVRQYWQLGLPGIIGLHLEGPYINPIKKGAHIHAFIKQPVLNEVEALVQQGKGVIKMMTLAPEVCSDAVIAYLQQEQILLSAGHSNATYKEAMGAFEKGIGLGTHLYNAMSSLQHRAPGIVGAILDAPGVQCSVVADGHHVDYAAIRIAKKIMHDRLFLITDAVTSNHIGEYQHRLQGDKYVVGDGILSGSALTMLQAVKNCVQHIGISLEEALRMASTYPTKAIAIAHQYGKIKPGYEGDLLWLNNDGLSVKGIFTNGSWQLP